MVRQNRLRLIVLRISVFNRNGAALEQPLGLLLRRAARGGEADLQFSRPYNSTKGCWMRSNKSLAMLRGARGQGEKSRLF